jgi:hypothetical protein
MDLCVKECDRFADGSVTCDGDDGSILMEKRGDRVYINNLVIKSSSSAISTSSLGHHKLQELVERVDAVVGILQRE